MLVHHSVMPEMLPCPLSLNKYNPAFRSSASDEAADHDHDETEVDTEDEEEENYLDPERDYELINNLRQGLLKQKQKESFQMNGHVDDILPLQDVHLIESA